MLSQRKTTIREIAERANVSISTVSRVLNNTARVAEDKRSAVLAAIEELDYQPNVLAQGLAGGQSQTIGVLTQFISSPHFGTVTRGVIYGLNGSGYSVIFADGSFNPTVERKIVDNLLLLRKVDVLIVVEGRLSDEVLIELGEQIPLIVVGRTIPALRERCIAIDQFKAAYRATQFLLELGHRH